MWTWNWTWTCGDITAPGITQTIDTGIPGWIWTWALPLLIILLLYMARRVLGPTTPAFWAYNPAYAQVQNEHVWAVGWVDIMKEGMAPAAAADKAFKRIEEIFAKYPIQQG